jgi:hypothetical protein
MNNNRKKCDITLARKKEILDFMEKNPRHSLRSLANHFSISLGAINKIIKNSALIKSELVIDVQKRKRILIKTDKIDSLLYEWFQSKRQRNFTMSGENLKEMARKLGEKFNLENFNASNGWLGRFQERYNITSKSICEESGIVDTSIISRFKSQFVNKLKEYDNKNIFNCDETGLFYRQSQLKTLTMSSNDKACGKLSRERITVLFCCSMKGEKSRPVLIGNAKKPRCFKNKKSCMTFQSFNAWLQDLNQKMKFESRKILLLLDNTPVHPIDVQYSNIEFFYFPPNVTSLIQPLDQGIIKNFKIFYKKEMQRKLLFEIDDDNNFGLSYLDVLKKITLLFTKLAWDSLEFKTIENCFSHAFKNAEIADLTIEFWMNQKIVQRP